MYATNNPMYGNHHHLDQHGSRQPQPTGATGTYQLAPSLPVDYSPLGGPPPTATVPIVPGGVPAGAAYHHR